MKKTIKLLLFVVAMFVVTNVKAMSDSVVLIEDPNQRFFSGNTEFHFKKLQGNDYAYAFCLDSNLSFVSGSTYNLASSISGINGNSIRNVIFKAYADGLGTERNVYGLSNYDFYGVTQMAVWNAAHGSNVGGMRSSTYKKWLEANPARSEAYNALVSAVDPVIPKYEFSVDSSSEPMTVSSDKKYFVSEAFKINGSSNLTYTVKASDGACVLYKGSCNATQVVDVNSEFKLRTNYVVDTEVNVSATISSSSYLKSYDFALFTPDKNVGTVQNLSVFIPVFDKFTSTISTKGYDEKVYLNVSKTDATGQKELPGASLTIKDSNGEVVDTWISTTEEHRVDGLEIGAIYEIIEDYAPAGYQPLQNSIKFVLNEDGSVTTCDIKKDSNGKDICEPMSTEDILKIKNEVIKTTVVISKKDFTNGKELPGAHLQILNEKGEVVADWISTEEDYVIEGLSAGKYTLIETLPVSNYQSEMIINGNRISSYEFEITDGSVTKIDVYNELETIDVPNTGLNSSSIYVIGGLIMLTGIGTMTIARRKENM